MKHFFLLIDISSLKLGFILGTYTEIWNGFVVESMLKDWSERGIKKETAKCATGWVKSHKAALAEVGDAPVIISNSWKKIQ